MLIAQLRALPRSAWVLFAGAFVNRFGTFVLPFLVLYLTHSGYSPAQAGLAISAYGIGSVGAAALGGELADRFGRRATIAASMFASAALMLALSQARGLPLIVLLSALAGVASELYRPAAGALLADVIPPGQRVTGFAFYRLAINTGVAAGVAVAGVLAERSYLLLFAGDALSSIIFAILALAGIASSRTARTSAPPPSAGQPPEPFLRQLARVDRRFLLFLVAATASACVYFQSLTTLGLQVRADHLPTTAYGALLSLNGLLILLLEVPLTTLTQRFRARWIIAAGFLLNGLGFGLTALFASFPGLSFTVALWTLGEMLDAPTASAFVADRAPAHLRGRYQGLLGLTSAIGLIVGPALGTTLFARGPSVLWLVCGLVGAVAALITLFV